MALGLVAYPVKQQVRHTVRTIKGMHDDQRDRLAAWVRANLPADAVILQEENSTLWSGRAASGRIEAHRVPQKIVTSQELWGLAPYENLLSMGVTHVVLCPRNYGRFTAGLQVAREEAQEEFARSREFYRRILDNGPPKWRSKRDMPRYFRPGLELYELREARPAGIVR